MSSVTDMSNVFNTVVSFNQDLSVWDVSSVADMSCVFHQAVSFNQGLLSAGNFVPRTFLAAELVILTIAFQLNGR